MLMLDEETEQTFSKSKSNTALLICTEGELIARNGRTGMTYRVNIQV